METGISRDLKKGGTSQTRGRDKLSGQRDQGGSQGTSAGGGREVHIYVGLQLKTWMKPPRQQRTQRDRCCTRPALPPHPRGGAAERSTSSEPSSPSKPPPVCSTPSEAGRGQRVCRRCTRRRWCSNTPEQKVSGRFVFEKVRLPSDASRR